MGNYSSHAYTVRNVLFMGVSALYLHSPEMFRALGFCLIFTARQRWMRIICLTVHGTLT
jgi:hypothetical protein